MSYEARTGAVLFAKNLDRVATFYAAVLDLSEANRADDHILLESPDSNWSCIESSVVTPQQLRARRLLDGPRPHSSRCSSCRALLVSAGLPRRTAESWSRSARNGHSTASRCAMDATPKVMSFSFASRPPQELDDQS